MCETDQKFKAECFMLTQYLAGVFYAFVGINLFVALPFIVVTDASPTSSDLFKTFLHNALCCRYPGRVGDVKHR